MGLVLMAAVVLAFMGVAWWADRDDDRQPRWHDLNATRLHLANSRHYLDDLNRLADEAGLARDAT